MPPASVVRLARAVAPPTTPLNVVAPVDMASRKKPPSTVPLNTMLPLRVKTFEFPTSVVALFTLKFEFSVWYEPPSVTVSSL